MYYSYWLTGFIIHVLYLVVCTGCRGDSVFVQPRRVCGSRALCHKSSSTTVGLSGETWRRCGLSFSLSLPYINSSLVLLTHSLDLSAFLLHSFSSICIYFLILMLSLSFHILQAPQNVPSTLHLDAASTPLALFSQACGIPQPYPPLASCSS